jgi:hypothetical protein
LINTLLIKQLRRTEVRDFILIYQLPACDMATAVLARSAERRFADFL